MMRLVSLGFTFPLVIMLTIVSARVSTLVPTYVKQSERRLLSARKNGTSRAGLNHIEHTVIGSGGCLAKKIATALYLGDSLRSAVAEAAGHQVHIGPAAVLRAFQRRGRVLVENGVMDVVGQPLKFIEETEECLPWMLVIIRYK